jgi:serine/threonine protein kinase/Tfp pilus assembly protein PilF
MDGARWKRIQELFLSAAELPPSEQSDFLLSECGEDAVLRDEVDAMLREDADAESLLDGDLSDATTALFGDFHQSPDDPTFAPYHIVKLIGEGGMGIVYLANREDFRHSVALKVLRDGLFSPERRERFAYEQTTLAQLKHPNIAQIFHAGTTQHGTPWFAMEYVEGKPITDYCRVLASVEERLRLFRDVCEAVLFAHQHLVIHRDLKPSNILVQVDGKAKLLDFGIAKRLEDIRQPVEQTATTIHTMTLAYASPEQILGAPLGIQTDVYSLGVILYELLTGVRPFDLSNPGRTESERIILETQPAPPSVVQRDSPSVSRLSPVREAAWKDLDALCLTAMHKDLNRRYKSVEALLRDIDHFLKQEPIEARPDSFRYRFGKFVIRNRGALAMTAAITALIAGLVLFFAARLTKARNVALAENRRTQRIESFMLNLFDGGDKTSGPSEDLRVLTLLDRGVKSASTLNSEPSVQAELDETLGHIYQNLGRFDAAEPLLRSSVELQTNVTGRDDPDTAGRLISLGMLRLDEGKVQEAEQLVRQGLAIDRRHLPPRDPAIARAESALGHVLEDHGAYPEAVNVLSDALQVQSAQPDQSSELSNTMHGLADAQYYLGHLAEADALDKQALAMDTRVYGKVHPRVADVAFDLGLIQHDLGHDAEAERYYRQSLAINQEWYGLEHPRTALSIAAVGQSLIYQSQYEKAAPLLAQALAIQKRVLPNNHPQIAMGYNTLGLLEIRRGHLGDAEQDFSRMEEINRDAYGDRHYLVGIAQLNLGQVYLLQKQYARAEAEYREALSRFKEKLPPGHASTAIAENQLGHILVLEKRFKEAELQLLSGYGSLTKQPSGQEARLQQARSDLITVYDNLHEPDQAERFGAGINSSPARLPSQPKPR